jgi:6-phosphogluconolactonase (cycloisomerase 2 family)
MAAGDTASGVYFHPSGKYLFVNNLTTNQVTIAYVSRALKKLEASGSSIPGLASIAFSPDGRLVYALESNEILVYGFNPHTGLLTARTIVKATGVDSILPWQWMSSVRRFSCPQMTIGP